MAKIDIAGLKIDSLAKPELLTIIQECMIVNQKIWITTVYSEFLYAGLKDPKVMDMLNKADIAIPDGVSIFWAHRFLSIPLTAKNYWLKILQAFWQAFRSLLSLACPPKPWRRREGRGQGEGKLKDRIPGSLLLWDIARLAAENNLSIFLLGGFGDTPKIVSAKFQNFIKKSVSPKISGRHLDFARGGPECNRMGRLKVGIAGYSNKNADDGSVIADIQKAKPDILLVAYGPIKQEQWIFENRDKLTSVKLFMGVGGAFDYIAGKRLAPPKFIRAMGLEWLWRLFTQPYRIKRIYNATVGLITMLIRYKVFSSMPLRRNVAIVILNKNNQILICQRRPANHHVDIIHNKESLSSKNYWQFPQGGIDENEGLAMAAKREALEETGLNSLEFVMVSPQTHTYIWNNALRKFWKNRFYQNCGQTQNIVYFKYGGDNNDVKIDNREFINYRWINIGGLENILHPERLPLAKIIKDDLSKVLFAINGKEHL